MIPYTPHEYQKQAIKLMVSQGAAGLFLDPGLGKTSVTLAAFSLLKAKRVVRRMLVVAPLRPAQSTWPAELRKWADFQHLTMDVLHGPKKGGLLEAGADVQVINPEGLEWLFRQPSVMRELPWQMLVVDESTKFKHSTTKRFRTLRPQLAKFKRRYILTGSPAPNGLIDLFGQMFLLDFGHALGPYVTHYRARYFIPSGYGGYDWRLRAGAETEIHERIRPLVLRLDAQDLLELPPLVENTVRVELPPEARGVYDQMERAFVAELKTGAVTAANAAVASGKCRQIANGGVFTEPDRSVEIHDAKTEALCDLLEELGGKPALVAYEFRHDLDRIRARLGNVPYIGGGVSAGDFKRLESDWNLGRLPVLLAQPQSVAHGLNLQGVGAAVIWFGLTWNLEHYEQFVRRVWRQGQKARVVVHHIVAQNTVDEVVMRVIEKKDRTQRALLSALKEAYDASKG